MTDIDDFIRNDEPFLMRQADRLVALQTLIYMQKIAWFQAAVPRFLGKSCVQLGEALASDQRVRAHS